MFLGKKLVGITFAFPLAFETKTANAHANLHMLSNLIEFVFFAQVFTIAFQILYIIYNFKYTSTCASTKDFVSSPEGHPLVATT